MCRVWPFFSKRGIWGAHEEEQIFDIHVGFILFYLFIYIFDTIFAVDGAYKYH